MLAVVFVPSGVADDSSKPKITSSRELAQFLDQVKNPIKCKWFPLVGQESKTVVTVFKIRRDGTISDLGVLNSYGSKSADESAACAIKNSAPFGKLPNSLGAEIGVEFVFNEGVFIHGRQPATTYDFEKNTEKRSDDRKEKPKSE